MSNWKKDSNIVASNYEDNTVLFNIGSILIGWMLIWKIRDKKTVTISRKEKSNVIMPTRLLTDAVTNKIVYNMPKKLPMLVVPKPYSKELLGGYLLNDKVTTGSMLIKKWSNKEQTILVNNKNINNIIKKFSSVCYKINTDVL